MPELPDLPKKLPHRIVDGLLDAGPNIIKSVGDAVASALDGGPLGSEGPHSGAENIVDGIADGVSQIGEGVANALDKPAEVARR